ncbi:hypothetical protein AAFP35_18085 [Gordonia sp. CPCC 206044]|uniref:hypothetical protein n=1 Tax=Gordonia sp. CPCC 206044 TaxID=3140793 RepID=UPI003AF3EDD8
MSQFAASLFAVVLGVYIGVAVGGSVAKAGAASALPAPSDLLALLLAIVAILATLNVALVVRTGENQRESDVFEMMSWRRQMTTFMRVWAVFAVAAATTQWFTPDRDVATGVVVIACSLACVFLAIVAPAEPHLANRRQLELSKLRVDDLTIQRTKWRAIISTHRHEDSTVTLREIVIRTFSRGVAIGCVGLAWGLAFWAIGEQVAPEGQAIPPRFIFLGAATCLLMWAGTILLVGAMDKAGRIRQLLTLVAMAPLIGLVGLGGVPTFVIARSTDSRTATIVYAIGVVVGTAVSATAIRPAGNHRVSRLREFLWLPAWLLTAKLIDEELDAARSNITRARAQLRPEREARPTQPLPRLRPATVPRRRLAAGVRSPDRVPRHL